MAIAEYIGLREYKTPIDMDLAEIYWINELKPIYNKASKHNAELASVSFADSVKENILPIAEWI